LDVEEIKEGQLIIPKQLFDKIPGIKQSGWQYSDYENFVKNDSSNINFYAQCRNLIQKLKLAKNAWPFLKPVDPKEVPDYYEIIKEPMDISTLESNLESGMYKNKEKFVKDVRKIFINAKAYNKPHTIYHKYAKDIESSIEDSIKCLKDN
jgi:histone acetyltransferase